MTQNLSCYFKYSFLGGQKTASAPEPPPTEATPAAPPPTETLPLIMLQRCKGGLLGHLLLLDSGYVF